MIDRAQVPLRRRKQDRPRELLLAALALFIEKGFVAARIDEIAERAGVSKGTLYLYFGSKEAMFSGLLSERFFCAFPFEDVPMQEGRPGSQLLHDVMVAWRAALIGGPVGGVVKLVFTEVHHFPALAELWVQRILAPTRAVVRAAVQRAVADAEFRAVEPELVTNALVLPVIATCLHRHALERGDRVVATARDQQGDSLGWRSPGVVAALVAGRCCWPRSSPGQGASRTLRWTSRCSPTGPVDTPPLGWPTSGRCTSPTWRWH